MQIPFDGRTARLACRRPKSPSEPTVSFFIVAPSADIETCGSERHRRYHRANFRGDFFNRSAKIDTVNSGNESEYIAMRTATETVKEPFIVRNCEGWCPLAMKRA
jgi:hypothetical protein